MRYSRYVALLCLMVAFQSQAQDISNFSQFFLNPYMLNPSYVGIEGRSAFFLAYRKQWTTIQGAPVLANLSFHTPLSKRLSLGLNLNSDKRGITNTSSVLLTLGYSVPIDKETFIRFGLSAGYAYNSIDWEKVGTFTDPALSTLLTKTSTLLGNAGVSFHKKTFHAGIALPNIFQPIYLSNESFTVTALKPFQSVVVHASNRFYFSKDKNVFEPYLIYRLNNGLPSQLEAAAIVHLQHVVWVGASYKQQFG
ncbi:MAG TPA: PorP/SprF family type IX secretion system membrane protein, partial [Cyclobacteriaceae bacterium]|nr:PorP/SprF family type IX secretion system membrane protein [Cyclobacteriaceae bacterium]